MNGPIALAVFFLAQAPVPPAAKPKDAPPMKVEPPASPKAEAKQKVDAAPAEAAPKDAPPSDPKVAAAVEKMQKFYEDTQDFTAHFDQAYTYKTLHRTQKSSGEMRFQKKLVAMRWDYEKPSPKTLVVASNKVYMYDPEAKEMVVSGIDTDKLSTSVTFLFGQGKLTREFNIAKAERKDLADGIALELNPKVPDPRFKKVFFLLDPANYAVKTSIVIDPDGSENRMTFSDVKTNTGMKADAFHIEPAPDTHVRKLGGAVGGSTGGGEGK